ncbi:7TM diverse intracellular signaling domain-containing protein [Emticicia sp. W12TSBA100-4]|uniref:sensor histidine kinase n=1 Tax=Emticicia sp. W12TSBA100-4 TaxID=3160965 RepID=UPI003305B306
MENFTIKKNIIIIFSLIISVGCKSDKIKITDKLQKIKCSYLIQEGSTYSIENIIKDSSLFKPLFTNCKNFGEKKNGVWHKCDLKNIANIDSNFIFITRGVDSLKFYAVINNKIINSSVTGGHFNPNTRDFNSPFSTFQFTVLSKQKVSLYIFAKNVNYKLSLFPFTIKTLNEAKTFILDQQLLHSCYIGAMVMLLLFGTTLFLLFRDLLYLYYSVGVGLSLGMMLVNFDYFYIFTENLPEVIRNKNIYGFFTSVLPLNYFLFAQKFLKYDTKTKLFYHKITPYVVVISLLIVGLFLVSNLSVFEYRVIFEILVFILCVLPLILLYKSFKLKYQPAWIFLVATFPVLISGIVESLSELHDIPVQLMHNYYYVLTFFELFVLTIGLSIKFKNLQEERKKVVEEMLERELSAKDAERRRIALDLHDKLGGLVSAAKLNFNVFKDSITKDAKNSGYEKGMKILDTTAQTIRDLAHSYTTSSMLKVGIVQALKEIYMNSQNPTIHINDMNFEKRLDPQVEHSLFMIIQEAITNAVKHANANEILIFFNEKQNQISVTIEDDGKGFQKEAITTGMGLKNIKFRVNEQLKGVMSIDSFPEKGTTILIKFYRE